jgi:hypothetical protein
MKLNYQYGLKLNSSDICTKSAEDLPGDSESMSYLEMNDHTLKKVFRAFGQKIPKGLEGHPNRGVRMYLACG